MAAVHDGGPVVDDDLAGLLVRARDQDGVLTRSDLLRARTPPSRARALVRSGSWEPLLRGSYLVEPWREGSALQRAWARSAVLTVRGSVLALGTASRLHGWEGAPRSGAVEVVVDRHVDPGRRRLAAHALALGAGDVVDLGGLPVTSPVRTLADLVPRLERLDAIALLDSALRSGTTDAAGLAAARRAVVRRPGCRHVDDLWALANGRAETPLESRARLRCLDDGLVPVALQHEVRDERGRLLARADLAFDRGRGRPPLLLEADGRGPHDSPEALYRDRWRANALVALGHPVVRCTWADTCSRLAVPTMVRAAL